MKKFIMVFLLGSLLVSSCKKDDINNTADKVGISRVTRFPTFTFNGAQYMSIVKGNAFTDPGVVAKEGSSTLNVTTSGTVNTNTTGVYTITYTATNKDGFSSSVNRVVAVLPEAEVAGVNIAGSYQNQGSFSYTATMEKLAAGFYRVNNIWGGASAAIIPSYVLTIDGTNIIVPTNALSSYGRIVGSGVMDNTGLITYTLSLPDQGVSNSVKKWRKL